MGLQCLGISRRLDIDRPPHRMLNGAVVQRFWADDRLIHTVLAITQSAIASRAKRAAQDGVLKPNIVFVDPRRFAVERLPTPLT